MKPISPQLEKIANHLAQFTRNSDQIYWLNRPDMARLVFISDACEKISGCPSSILYKNIETWIDYMVPEDITHHPLHAMAECVATLGVKAKFTATYRIKRPDKEIRWIVDRGFTVCDSNGNVLGVTGVAIDVTEDKKIIEATGVSSFFPKLNTIQELTKLLQEKIILPNDSRKNSQLTPRECQCIIYLMQGYRAKLIAKKLNLSHRTVEHHIERVKLKLGCDTTTQLVDICWQAIIANK